MSHAAMPKAQVNNSATRASASIGMSGAAIMGDSLINMAYLNGQSTSTAVMDLFSSDSSTSGASLLDYTV